jgi:hypothetical protein
MGALTQRRDILFKKIQAVKYGHSPLSALNSYSLVDILEANTMKGLLPCPHCSLPWRVDCPHVINTFTGPVYMER